ncbi:hypothetical protein ABPG72_018282 [Tetrahymena utriculariae]
MNSNHENNQINSSSRVLSDHNNTHRGFFSSDDMQNNYMIFKNQQKYFQSQEVSDIKSINQKPETATNIIENYYQDDAKEQIFKRVYSNDEVLENYLNQNEQHKQDSQNLSFSQQSNQRQSFQMKIKQIRSSVSSKNHSISSEEDDYYEKNIINNCKVEQNQEADIQAKQLQQIVKNKKNAHLSQEQEEFIKELGKIKNFFKIYNFILPKIKKFFFLKTIHGKTRKLTVQMRRIIGDKSDQYLNESKGCATFFSHKLLILLEKLSQYFFLNKIPIFNPENIFKIIFNIMTVTYSCFYLFMTSLKIFFVSTFGVYDHYLHLAAEIVWVLEMIVQMNTAMYYKDQFTKDRRLIMKIYLKEYLFFEVVPLVFENLSFSNPILHLCFKLPLLLKMKGILQNIKYIEFYILQKLENHTILFLFKLIFALLIFAHVVSCSFSSLNAIQITFYNEHTDWTINQQDYLRRGEWFEHYLWAVNWSLNIMFSNYNKQPQSRLEIGFTCVCMIVSCIAFGYIVSSIGSLLNEIDKEQNEYKQDLNILNLFMKRKQIDISLVRRVNIHLKKYYDQKKKVNYMEESKTLQKLSDFMSKELQIAANIKILRRFPMFEKIFSDQTIYKICTVMKERLYYPNQVIFDLKNQQQNNLYLIVNGAVLIEHPTNMDYKNTEENESSASSINYKIYQNKTQSDEKKLTYGIFFKKDQCFGQYGFFTGCEQITLATSIKFTTLITINREDLLTIVKENKSEFEKFMEVKDKIALQGNFSNLQIPCLCCQQVSHDSNLCPQTHKVKDPYFQCVGAYQNILQGRSEFPNRRKKQKIKNIQQQALIHEKAYQFVIDYGLFEFLDNQSDDREEDKNEEDSKIDNFDDAELIFKRREIRLKSNFYNQKVKSNKKEQYTSEKREDDSSSSGESLAIEQSQKDLYPEKQTTEKNNPNSKSHLQDEDTCKEKRSSFVLKTPVSNFDYDISEINNESEHKSMSFRNLKRCSIEKEYTYQNSLVNPFNILKNNETIAKHLCSNIYHNLFGMLNKTIPKMLNKLTKQNSGHKQSFEYSKNEDHAMKLNSLEEVIQNRQQRKITFRESNYQTSLSSHNTMNYCQKDSNLNALQNQNNNKTTKYKHQNSKLFNSKNSQENQFTLKDEIDQMFINGMDRMCQFFNYFPQNNQTQVINQFHKYQAKLLEKLKLTKKKRKFILKRKNSKFDLENIKK